MFVDSIVADILLYYKISEKYIKMESKQNSREVFFFLIL